MTDWLEQYSAALDVRDTREKAHKPYIDAYTRLADRTAAAVSVARSRTVHIPTENPTSSAPPSRSSTPRGKKAAPTDKEDDQNPTELLASLRADLGTTQKARAVLQTRVAELTLALSQARLQDQRSTAQIALLNRQKAEVERKLKDREEEIHLKGKLVEKAQDEMVAQGLALSIAEQRSEKLVKENQELVDRWMKRMGEEVERVNRDSRWE